MAKKDQDNSDSLSVGPREEKSSITCDPSLLSSPAGIKCIHSAIIIQFHTLHLESVNLGSVLIHQGLRLFLIQEDGKSVVVVPPVRVVREAKLPVHVREPLLDADGLPLAQRLDPGDVGRSAEVLELLLRRQPAVLLVHDRLSDGTARGRVVPDPLARPLDRLAPPVGVGVEDPEVNVGQGQLGVEVATVVAIVEPVGVGGVVEAALAAPGDQVVAVEALYVCAHLVGPLREQIGRAVWAPGKVAGAVGAAAGLVGELPCKDCWRVLEASDHGFRVAFVCLLDLGKSVELASLLACDMI